MKSKLIPAPLLLCLFSLIVSIVFYFSQLNSWNLEQQSSTRFLQQSFKASISQYEYLPALLASDDNVKNALIDQNGDQKSLNRQLKFVAHRSGASAVYLMNKTGKVLAASNFDQSSSFLHQNYSFRPYFKNAIEQGTRQLYYAIGATTGIPGFFISESVSNDSGDVIGVIVVKLDLREWETNWRDAGQNILVASENNVIILSGREQWRYKSVGQLSDQVQSTMLEQQQFGKARVSSLFQKTYEFARDFNLSLSFWMIDDEAYLVNSSPIKDTNWNLYYLEKNSRFTQNAVIFFIIFFGALFLAYLYYRERQSRLKSRKQAEDNELRHRRELEAIIEKIQIGVVSINLQGDILFLNDAAKELLQLDTTTENQKLIPIQSVLDMSMIDMSIRDQFENNQLQQSNIMVPFHETNVLSQNQKSTPVMFAISQVNIESDTRLLVTLINIEKRKKAQQAVIKLNESLEEQVEHRTQALRDAQTVLVQQSKAAALGQMAATVVHELSQPLSAMNSSITAAQLKVKKDDWTGAVNSISRLAPLSEKMNNVIKLLKYFSYEDGESIQRQDLALLIKKSINLYQDKLKERQVNINLDNLQSSVTVKINPLKLDLVLTNIIQNAIDAMNKCDQPVITIAMVSSNDKAIITIEDQGDGIDSRVMGQLFDPYFTTKDIGKGLGLGLSICYEIIQEYHGSIVAENRANGARFTITLPFEKN
jgi:two-component system C4-dicarboxylate transport sensor histidine kinase DctB